MAYKMYYEQVYCYFYSLFGVLNLKIYVLSHIYSSKGIYVSSCRRGTVEKGMFTVMEAERADHKPAAQAGDAPLRIPAGKQIHLYSNST